MHGLDDDGPHSFGARGGRALIGFGDALSRHLAWTERERILYASHRARVEGVHGEEKAWHGLARAVRRGLANMKIQAYLTAAAVNLKRLAAAVAALSLMLLPIHRQSRSCTAA